VRLSKKKKRNITSLQDKRWREKERERERKTERERRGKKKKWRAAGSACEVGSPDVQQFVVGL